MEKEKKLPENFTFQELAQMVADLIEEVEQYRNSWPAEVVAQANRRAKRWFWAWLGTTAVLTTIIIILIL